MTDSVARARPENLIGGKWRPAETGDSYQTRNPWSPAEIVGTHAASGSDDVHAAAEAACEAFPAWAQLPAPERAIFLRRAADAVEARAERIAWDMTREMGKPLREARAEAARAAQILRFAAGEAFRPIGEQFEPSVINQRLYTLQRPVGAIGLITPWNFPIAIPVWKLAPALIYGNTVVLKLALNAPRTGLHVAEAFVEAELPGGVLNVLTGPGQTAGAALVNDDRISAISFTGSVAVGHGVREQATRRSVPVQLELGGHNPLIVTGDADIQRAVEAAYAGAFWSAGQKCTATRRIYVHDSVYADFRTLLLRRIADGVVGDPSQPDTEVGPLVSENQLNAVTQAIEQAKREGASLIAGGERCDDFAYLLSPTVFEGAADESVLSCEEIFGPVTSLYQYSLIDEVIARANAVPFGLSASIFTRNLATVQQFTTDLQAGVLHINSQTAGADVHVPFGGLKASGWGPHEQGRAAREFYTKSITVYEDAPTG